MRCGDSVFCDIGEAAEIGPFEFARPLEMLFLLEIVVANGAGGLQSSFQVKNTPLLTHDLLVSLQPLLSQSLPFAATIHRESLVSLHTFNPTLIVHQKNGLGVAGIGQIHKIVVNDSSEGAGAHAANALIAHFELLFVCVEESLFEAEVAGPERFLDGLAHRLEGGKPFEEVTIYEAVDFAPTVLRQLRPPVSVKHADRKSVDVLELVAGEGVLAGTVGLVLQRFHAVVDDVLLQVVVRLRKGTSRLASLLLVCRLRLAFLDRHLEHCLVEGNYLGGRRWILIGAPFGESGERVRRSQGRGRIEMRLYEFVFERGNDELQYGKGVHAPVNKAYS